LEARRPREALPVLDKDILEVPHKLTPEVELALPCADHERSSGYIKRQSGLSADVTVLQVQEYYLMGAFVYTGLRRYERAKLMLELVMATPSQNHAVDTYMLEAYKKLVLIGLVSKGYSLVSSTLVDSSTLRPIQQLSKAYDSLAEAFRNRDLAKFRAEVDMAGSLWADDGNLGLVAEAAESLQRHRVLDLRRTYASLTVDRVATSLSMSSQATLQLLQTMIQQGHVQASISGVDTGSLLTNGSAASHGAPLIRFQACDPSKATHNGAGSEVDGDIHAQIQRIDELSKAVREADRKLAITKEYGEWLRRNKKSADAGAAAFEDPMEMDNGPDMPGNFVSDEDIMAT